MVEHLIYALSTLLDETCLLQYLGDEFATRHTIDRKDIVHINTNRETSCIGDDELVGILLDHHIALDIHHTMATSIEDCFSYYFSIERRNVANTEAVVVVLKWIG